jgi:predicted RNA-binding Zn-ribbon protein involved in translation (DUF1610 family)
MRLKNCAYQICPKCGHYARADKFEWYEPPGTDEFRMTCPDCGHDDWAWLFDNSCEVWGCKEREIGLKPVMGAHTMLCGKHMVLADG